MEVVLPMAAAAAATATRESLEFDWCHCWILNYEQDVSASSRTGWVGVCKEDDLLLSIWVRPAQRSTSSCQISHLAVTCALHVLSFCFAMQSIYLFAAIR